VGIGENAFGGRVAAISQGAVTLEFDAQLVELRLPANLAAAALPAPAVLPPASLDPPEDPETPARSMARREVDRRLGSEMARILTETTIVPVTEEGRVVGFNVTRLPEGSLLADAGLRAGDVLMRINDVPIDSLATLIALWPRLQNESHLRAVVLRNGRPVSLAVTLK
jgi:type II secretory pathway component PulC